MCRNLRTKPSKTGRVPPRRQCQHARGGSFLIVGDVTHDKKWLDRAIRVASVIIHDVARNNHYRVNEHFDTQWNPLPDYNKGNPAHHRFRAFEVPVPLDRMGRLMLHPCCLEACCEQPPAWRN